MKRFLFLAASVAIVGASGVQAAETVSTGFSLADGFTIGGTAPVTVSSGGFSVEFSGGQQQQSFDGPSYNQGPDAYLFISGPSFTGSFGGSAPGTGDKGLADLNKGASEVSVFVANRALGAATTVRVFGRDGVTELGTVSVSQTSNRVSDGATPTVLKASDFGALIGGVEFDNPGPAGNPPYVTAIDTFSATTDVVYAEDIDGDLSTDPATPTAVSFGAGSNVVTGRMSAGLGDTRDYFTFTLGPGQQLEALNLLEYDDPNAPGIGGGDRGFHALFAGAVGALPTTTNNLGGDHLDPAPFGTDLLPNLAEAALNISGPGFDTPLGPGTYTYLIQQTGSEINDYALDFVVAQVPEPTALGLLLSGVSLACVRRRG